MYIDTKYYAPLGLSVAAFQQAEFIISLLTFHYLQLSEILMELTQLKDKKKQTLTANTQLETYGRNCSVICCEL